MTGGDATGTSGGSTTSTKAGQEDDYENQGEGGSEARETVRGDADDAMGERRAVEGGGPGGATKEGGGGRRGKGRKGKEEMDEE